MNLQEGRILLNNSEQGAIEDLISKNPDLSVSLTRRDPNETGPVLVHIGDRTFEVDNDGRATKVKT